MLNSVVGEIFFGKYYLFAFDCYLLNRTVLGMESKELNKGFWSPKLDEVLKQRGP